MSAASSASIDLYAFSPKLEIYHPLVRVCCQFLVLSGTIELDG
ncbi:MAG: hypothetical protein SWY16_17300 [Cyanobacteriota bacterium]|nr:hypothetical protein [Cyanobacteriota bacterium]